MPNHFLTIAGALVSACFIAGCNASEPSTWADKPVDDPTGLQLFFTPTGDVASIDVAIKRVSCAGEPITQFSYEDTIQYTDAPTDVFVYLDPGCYDLIAIPKTVDGEPSESCDAMSFDQLVIVSGYTTEAGVQMICDNPPRGALDVNVVTTNAAPKANLVVTRVSCSGEPIDPLEFVETTSAGSADTPVVSTVFLVPPGCYEVKASPLASDGSPAETCLPLLLDAIVLDGSTTEVGGQFVCL